MPARRSARSTGSGGPAPASSTRSGDAATRGCRGFAEGEGSRVGLPLLILEGSDVAGTVRTAVVGASGYIGVETLRLLHRHPGVTLIAITSERYAEKAVGEAFPALAGLFPGLVFRKLDPAGRAEGELVFRALPHKESMEVVPDLRKAGKRVVDLSADYRLHDWRAYEEWYGVPHTSKELLAEAVYGLPELHRDAIMTAGLVAVPGCYPTGAILALAPLLAHRLIDEQGIIVDAKTGISGAGRKPDLPYHFPEANEGVTPYGVPRHRHLPEMEQELSALAGIPLAVSFVPHLTPMTRGILTTAYAPLHGPAEQAALLDLYREYYRGAPFVRVSAALPSTRNVLASNYCDVSVRVDPRTRRVIALSAIDNLVKGGAGQGVQDMNLMCGSEETLGLEGAPVFP
ncbi:MAG: N-acetyl-gamma-glutamyl-phosphate reductase [Deltaproteobacteria bacterium]|nr:N-acetyl-gamma-glutamyl-phosphate reductase [Deltaproteobacteria bacterium]